MKKSAQLKAALKDILALEKTLKDQMHTLTASMAANDLPRPQASAAPRKPAAPFPTALGEYLLKRLTQLEAATDRLAIQAERQGDHKSALKAIQVSVRLINTIVRLADKHPHLAENWQLPTLEQSPEPKTTSLLSDLTKAEEKTYPLSQPLTGTTASGLRIAGS